MLSEEEVAELRRLVVRIHVRRESVCGVIPPDEEFQMLSWLTSLRDIATAMGRSYHLHCQFPLGWWMRQIYEALIKFQAPAPAWLTAQIWRLQRTSSEIFANLVKVED